MGAGADQLILALLGGLSVFVALWSLLGYERDPAGGVRAPDEPYAKSVAWRAIEPYVRSLGAVIARLPSRANPQWRAVGWAEVLAGPIDGLRGLCRRRIHGAGKAATITPDEFIATVIIAGMVGSLIGLFMWAQMPSMRSLVLFFGAIGFLVPIANLMESSKTRVNEIRRYLPYSLDLLTLSVESGLDFTTSLQRIVDRQKANALAQEFALTLNEVKVGKTRSQAMRDLSARIPVDDLRSLANTIIQTDELGSSLGTALRIQADALRESRSQKAEKAANEAPVKMLFPLLFFFGASVIVVFAPIVIDTIGLP